MEADARVRAGISDTLLRLSVGIEHVDDLIFDINRALDSAVAPNHLLSAGR
jgi:cystathionine gamma-lyase